MELMALRTGNKRATLRQVGNLYFVEMYENARHVGTYNSTFLEEAKTMAETYVTEESTKQFLSE
jgi:hypothetical protein